jgi:imidazole glycerol phosphate synthase subunit HisF
MILIYSCDYTLYNPFATTKKTPDTDPTTIYVPPFLGEVRITNDSNISDHSSLVWTGTEYGICWRDSMDSSPYYEIYFTRLNASGLKIGSVLRITNNNTANTDNPSIVWNGLEYGVSWDDNRSSDYEIYFVRINADGTINGSELRITNSVGDSKSVSLVWTGIEYGVSWNDARSGTSEIYFVRINADGTKNGSDVRITNNSSSSIFSNLVWNGTDYGVTWVDYSDGNSEIYFARINADGTKNGSDVRITNDNSNSAFPSLEWNDNDNEYGVSWDDFRDGNTEIYFARINADGTKNGSDMRITNDISNSAASSLVWNGNEYGVAWAGDMELYFARINSNGTKNGSDVRITPDDSFGSIDVSSVWTGTDYGITYTDGRNGMFNEIYFATFDTTGIMK